MFGKVMIIGLDGATFDVIHPLVNRGFLPNIGKLMQHGVYGNLRSTIHPITPQAWTSFLTGKNAGKHGVLDFTKRKSHSYDIQFVNSSIRQSESILSILSQAGKTVGAIAIPFTFPPEPVNGFVLSGMDAPAEDKRSVFPESLYHDIKKKFGNYHIHLASPVGRKVNEEKFWKDIQTEDNNRTAISEYLMKKYNSDLFITVYNNTDRVQHQCLNQEFLDKLENRYEFSGDNLIVKTYQNVDRQIGRLLETVDQDTTVIVMSDHGSGPIKKVFFLNRWLEEQGYLHYKGRQSKPLLSCVQNTRFLAKRLLPRSIKNILKSKMAGFKDKVDSMLIYSAIDWGKTRAYGFGMYGNIFINLKGREPEGIVNPGKEYDEMCRDIINRLGNLKDSDTDKKIIEKVYKRGEIYHGPLIENAPDLLIGWKDYTYYTSVSLARESGHIFGPHLNIDSSEYRHVGTHRLNGIFIAAGPSIIRGGTIQGAKIYDIAPTLLYLLGQPIPEDMDGSVLLDALTEDYIQNHPVNYTKTNPDQKEFEAFQYSNEENDQVAERLRGLGYIE